jgi:UDP-N-acetylmuramate dehydrogenase
MRDHTTFRIGGPAKYFVTPKTQKELTDTVGLCRKEAMAFYVIGNGSNLLVSDKGYEGVIISTEGLASWQAAEDGEAVLSASAGILLSRLAKAAASKSLTGLEFAAGIPGTLGGAVVMNAGAYGSEMKDVICWARVLDRQGVVRTLTLEELGLGYRTSRVPAEGYVVLEAGLRLAEGCQEEIYKKMEDLAARRRKKQPLEYPSAGSAFKRPPGHFAGKLIDDAGLRGFRIGDAQVSEKHCGFVINRGNATEAQVTELCREVRRRVKEQFGVELELEVKKL